MSLCFQLFANCVFTLEIAMKFYQNQSDIHCPYLIINIIGTLATWTTLFFDMIQYDSYLFFQLFMIIRIARAVIRVMEVFDWLKTPF